MSGDVIHWQDFIVIGGAVARNQSAHGEQYEGRLELAGGFVLVFVFDRDGATWGWNPGPPFEVTRTESESEDSEPLPEPPELVISVWNCRAAVSGRVDHADGSWSYEPAQNWQDLEPSAILEVDAQGGAVNLSGHYECPGWLAERATFAEVKA